MSPSILALRSLLNPILRAGTVMTFSPPWPACCSLSMDCRKHVLAALLLLLLSTSLQARPPHKKALVDHFGPLLPKQLAACRTSHVPAPPNAPPDALVEEREHNAFGARLKSVKGELTKAGKKTDIPTRLDAVEDEDSDGDGVANLVELLLGHNPGEASDKPSDSELTSAATKVASYRDAQRNYRWRPFDIVQRPAIPSDRTLQATCSSTNPIDTFVNAE